MASHIVDFYTFEGAQALATALKEFDHGRLVVHITDMPIKCPAAPSEFTFRAEAWLRERGLRDRVELVYVTPLPEAKECSCRRPQRPAGQGRCALTGRRPGKQTESGLATSACLANQEQS